MKSRKLMAGFLALSIIIAVSCATNELSSPSASQQAQQVKEPAKSKAAHREVWETEWEKTVEAARKEAVVVIYSSSIGPAIREQNPLFNRRFGLRIDLISGRGSEMTAKMFQERKAGLFLVDITLIGMNNFFNETRPAGVIDVLEPSLILPEVVDPGLWFGGKLPWGDLEHRVLKSYAYPNNPIAVNTNALRPAEIKSYMDLLNPRWKGKIIMNDPTIAGVGLKTFSVLGFHILSLDFFRQLARQEPMIIRDQRLQVSWLAQGKYDILLFPQTAPMMEFLRAGAPIDFAPTPAEGVHLNSGVGNVTLVNRAPHPNAARVFINWLLSKEGQTLISAGEGVQSARVDVPTGSIAPSLVRQPGAKYFTEADSEEFLLKDPEYIRAAREIFGPMIR